MLKKQFKYNWFVLYYFSVAFSTIIIIALITLLFLDQININNHVIKYGDELFLGFYNLTARGDQNNIYINWIGILFAILVLLDTLILCICFYLYKWSKYEYYFKKYELAILIGCLIFVTVFFLILNFMNRIIVDLKNVNVLNNDWYNKITESIKTIKYNYVYNLDIYKVQSNVPIFSLTINYFGIFWIVIIVISIITMSILFLKIEYFKNKYYIKDIKLNE